MMMIRFVNMSTDNMYLLNINRRHYSINRCDMQRH